MRRVGLILAGVMPWGIIHTVWVTRGLGVSVYEAMFWWGVSIVFMTSPFLPPFWKLLLFGTDPVADPGDRRGLPRE
jgi:hypothetical protein